MTPTPVPSRDMQPPDPIGEITIAGTEGPEPSIEVGAKITSAGDISLPLDKYRPTPEDLQRRNMLWARLEQQCMQQYGLAGIVGQRFVSTEQSPTAKFLDPVRAKSDGYAQIGPQGLDILGEYRAEGSPISPQEGMDATAIYNGSIDNYQGKPVPQGGCRSEAEKKIIPGIEKLRVDVSDLVYSAAVAASRHSKVIEAQARWSQCMKSKGFEYISTGQASNVASQSSSDAAVRIAGADADCRVAVSLTETQVAAEVAYQNRLLSANLALVVAAKKFTDETMKRVEQLGG
ncbi:hypothetical protein [Nonomuraea wenchangensis]|uniref:hypothetical protein n=1 Tax=Nonomuraea wenchangensis TaxID=568860 RepID=UPI0033E9AA3F